MSRIKAWHYWLVALIAFSLDRASKYLACKYLGLVDYGVFPGFNLSLVYNRGVSFSMFSFVSPLHFWIISCLVIAILCIFAIHVWYEYKKGISIIGEVFVLAGALSNIIDRFVYGGVVDFLDFYFGYVHFPTFNLADCFIVCGILFIALRSLWYGIIRKA